MTTKKATANDVANDLAKHEIQCAERWKTAFNEFSDIKAEITNINSTIKTATFSIIGFIGAVLIAVLTSVVL